MKAIRVHEFGDPQVMKFEEVDDLHPAAGQLTVQVKAAGINPVDTYIRSGAYVLKPPLPYTPGMDAAGEILEIGDGVTRFKPGDRVYVAGNLTGAYAEQLICGENQAQPLPENVTFEQGACVYIPYATAFRALFHKAKARPGETLLIHGASGGVGVAATQIARAAGMRVIGTASTDKGKQLVLDQGAHLVVDHSQDGYENEILEWTGGRGVHVVLEMLANVNLKRDLQLIALRGRIVVIGSRGAIEFEPRAIMGKEANIVGMVIMTTPENEMAEIHAGLVAGLANGTLRPIVGKTFPLAEAFKGHSAVMERGAYGNIVLTA
ncbi:MAG: zinc-binding dehydrogenase [bacterium]|nr:zinc-binding dehydrogenase [bacterium]